MTNKDELTRQSNQLRREENVLKREEHELMQQPRGSPSQRNALMRNQEMRNKNKRQLREVSDELRKLERVALEAPAPNSALPSTAANFPPPLRPPAPPQA